MSKISSGLIGDFPYSIWEDNTMGHLCGYLGIPPAHPWYGRDYNSIDADIHGGLTYSSYRFHEFSELDIWWVGFDCAHAGDWTNFYATYPESGLHKWTPDEVLDELGKLAEQAYEAQTQMQTSNKHT